MKTGPHLERFLAKRLKAAQEKYGDTLPLSSPQPSAWTPPSS